jgi:hypothetical protein
MSSSKVIIHYVLKDYGKNGVKYYFNSENEVNEQIVVYANER